MGGGSVSARESYWQRRGWRLTSMAITARQLSAFRIDSAALRWRHARTRWLNGEHFSISAFAFCAPLIASVDLVFRCRDGTVRRVDNNSPFSLWDDGKGGRTETSRVNVRCSGSAHHRVRCSLSPFSIQTFPGDSTPRWRCRRGTNQSSSFDWQQQQQL